MSALLDVRNLSVDIPLAVGTLHAVQNVSFSVDKGETLCIVGESGCGKSLTSLALMGLLPKKAIRSGDGILFDGTDLMALSDRRMADLRGNRIGMIFQEPMTSLNPFFTDRQPDGGSAAAPSPRQPARGAGRAAIYLLEKVGITGRGAAAAAISAPAFRRHAPARDDRHGADAAARI